MPLVTLFEWVFQIKVGLQQLLDRLVYQVALTILQTLQLLVYAQLYQFFQDHIMPLPLLGQIPACLYRLTQQLQRIDHYARVFTHCQIHKCRQNMIVLEVQVHVELFVVAHGAENGTNLNLQGRAFFQQHLHEVVSQLLVVIDHPGKGIAAGYDVAETKTDLLPDFYGPAGEQILQDRHHSQAHHILHVLPRSQEYIADDLQAGPNHLYFLRLLARNDDHLINEVCVHHAVFVAHLRIAVIGNSPQELYEVILIHNHSFRQKVSQSHQSIFYSRVLRQGHVFAETADCPPNISYQLAITAARQEGEQGRHNTRVEQAISVGGIRCAKPPQCQDALSDQIYVAGFKAVHKLVQTSRLHQVCCLLAIIALIGDFCQQPRTHYFQLFVKCLQHNLYEPGMRPRVCQSLQKGCVLINDLPDAYNTFHLYERIVIVELFDAIPELLRRDGSLEQLIHSLLHQICGARCFFLFVFLGKRSVLVPERRRESVPQMGEHLLPGLFAHDKDAVHPLGERVWLLITVLLESRYLEHGFSCPSVTDACIIASPIYINSRQVSLPNT